MHLQPDPQLQWGSDAQMRMLLGNLTFLHVATHCNASMNRNISTRMRSQQAVHATTALLCDTQQPA
jgi:hypothetical protein